MDAIIVLLFIGIVMIGCAVIGFGFAIDNGEFDVTEQISLMPLEDDERGN